MNEQNLTDNERETLDLIPAYGMGLTDDDESRRVETLLRLHPDLRDEVDSYQQLAEAMLHVPTEKHPSLTVIDGIMQRIEAETASPEEEAAGAAPGLLRFPIRGLMTLAAALVAALAILSYLYADAVRQNDQINEQLGAQVAMIDLLARDDVVQFDLYSMIEDNDSVHGKLICNPQERISLLQVENFPKLKPNMAYQVWLFQGEERISGGVFKVDDHGKGSYVFLAPEVMGNYTYVGISPEDADGVPEPTNPPIARGALYDEEAADIRDEEYEESPVPQ